jgi:hypothetical protein
MMKESDVFVFGGPRSSYSQAELDDIRSHLNNGGRVLVFSTEENQQETNVNNILQE